MYISDPSLENSTTHITIVMIANTISYPIGTKNLQCGFELPFLIIEEDYTTLMLLENQLINWYVLCYIALL